jgi:dienelactone hydrolase
VTAKEQLGRPARPGRPRGRDLAVAAFAVPLVRAATEGVRFTARSAAARARGEPLWPGVPAPEPSVSLALAVGLDALLVQPMRPLASLAPIRHYEASSAELDDAVRFYEANGWLDDPSQYLRAPSHPSGATEHPPRNDGAPSLLTFTTGWAPRAAEPGAVRWQAAGPNRTVVVRLLRHAGEPRPWLIAIHGAGMGNASDASLLGMRRLHQRAGINIALPALPMHGPRRHGFSAEHMFVSNVYPVNNVLGLGQAVSDVRQILRWLVETERAPRVGLFGLSLGSVVTALVTSTEPDLACAIAVVPSTDFTTPIREMVPWGRHKRAAHLRVHDHRGELAHRLVSPLSHPSVVPSERCFIVAGQGDQVAAPTGAALLQRHWGSCDICWRPRGHLTVDRSRVYSRHLLSVLERAGMAVP